MMDTSKEYIKMCEKAEEIQKLFNPNEFNFLWDGRLRNSWDNDKYTYKGYRISKITEFGTIEGGHIFETNDGYHWTSIWLPRQDQLQEMIRKGNIQDIINDFSEWFNVPSEGPYFNSMEQLWLAFVMKKKYQKTWDGKEWIKVK